MTSRSEDLDPIREWTSADGTGWVAMHPLYAALSETLVPKSVRGIDAMRMLSRLLREIARGERRFSDSLAERVLEIDAEQRANGYPDENLGNLIKLLKEPIHATNALGQAM